MITMLAIVGAVALIPYAGVALFAGVNMFLLWIDPNNKPPKS